MTEERRGPWYLFTGLFIGLVLGLFAGWMLVPVQIADTSPAALREDFKREYLVQIALAFAATNDEQRAQSRLALLRDSNLPETVAALAQRSLADGRPEAEVQALGLLVPVASNLNSAPTAAPAFTTTQEPSATPTLEPTATPTQTPSPTTAPSATPTQTTRPSNTPEITGTLPTQEASATPTPSPEPSATPTPTPTPASPFILEARNRLCSLDYPEPRLIVRTRNAAGGPVPGVEIIINWPGNEEHFFTGLKPELGLDYADFTLTPFISYTLRLEDGSQRLTDLATEECTTAGVKTWVSWELIFAQP